MAIYFDAPVPPDALTAFVRDIPVAPELRLQQLFGTPRTVRDNRFDFANIVRTNRTAKYRSFDGRISVSERDAGGSGYVKLAPLSSSSNVGEYERLQMEFARTSGTSNGALTDAIYNDADNLTREVLNRLELAWGDVLADGKLTINENGLISEADYGLPVGHTPVAATVWSNPAAPILDNLRAWQDTYVDSAGTEAAWILTSRRVISAMRGNTQIINRIKGAAAGVTQVTLAELNQLLTDEGLPTLLPSYDYRLDVDGVTTRVLPEDRLAFLPQTLADLGETVMGISATALELVDSNVADFSFEEAPGIVGVVEKVGPPYRQFTFVDAVGQPVLTDARKLLTADVL